MSLAADCLGNHCPHDLLNLDHLAFKFRQSLGTDPLMPRDQPEPESSLVAFLHGDTKTLDEVLSAHGFVSFKGVGSDGSSGSQDLVADTPGNTRFIQCLCDDDNPITGTLDSRKEILIESWHPGYLLTDVAQSQ